MIYRTKTFEPSIHINTQDKNVYVIAKLTPKLFCSINRKTSERVTRGIKCRSVRETEDYKELDSYSL